jgi:hypothetical protein
MAPGGIAVPVGRTWDVDQTWVGDRGRKVGDQDPVGRDRVVLVDADLLKIGVGLPMDHADRKGTSIRTSDRRTKLRYPATTADHSNCR